MSKRLSDVIRNVRIDPRLQSYYTFFDHDFSRQLTDICEGTPLEQPASDLLIAWKSAANTAAFPWIAVQGIAQYHAGFTNDHDPEIFSGLNSFAARLFEEASLSSEQAQVVRSAVTDSKLLMQSIRKDRAKFDTDDLWHSMLGIGEFQLAVWGSQRVVFSNIYHEYEHFLKACLKVKSKDESLDLRGYERTKNLLVLHYNEQTELDCWSHKKVEIARRIRNLFAHSGGRIGEDDLRELEGQIVVEDGMLQIMPNDNQQLLNLLKTRVIQIVKLTK